MLTIPASHAPATARSNGSSPSELDVWRSPNTRATYSTAGHKTACRDGGSRSSRDSRSQRISASVQDIIALPLGEVGERYERTDVFVSQTMTQQSRPIARNDQ